MDGADLPLRATAHPPQLVNPVVKPGQIAERVPLAPLTTIQVGGTARFFLRTNQDCDLLRALKWAAENRYPVFVLGGGSNVVFSDSGFPGLVIQTGTRGIAFTATGDHVFARAEAGNEWCAFVRETVQRNLAGLECLAGIPGSVGASPVQNIGAYGQEVSDCIHCVDAVDRTTLETVCFAAADCDFSYRMSRFKGSDRDRYVITAVTFRLTPGGKPTLRYGDLTRSLEEKGIKQPDLQQVHDTVLAIRRSKGMITDPDEPNSRSCGSFFTNPIIPRSALAPLEQRGEDAGAIEPGETIPFFECGNDMVKLPAAWLIEHSGLRKGMRRGNAGLSEQHVLAIVNCGGATAREILEMQKLVQGRVRAVFGVELTPEPVLAGFDR